MLSNRLASSLAFLAVVAMCAASSFGQSQDESKNKQQERDPGVLAGPEVDATADKPAGGMMGPQGQARDRRNNDEMPFQQWMGALRGLSLSEAQQTKIRSIADEFQAAQREFQESLGDEGRSLMRQMRESRQAGSPPPADVREKLQKIEEGRPKPMAYQQRIWAELTPEQQASMKQNLDERRQRMQEQRERRRQEAMTTDNEMEGRDPAARSRRRPDAEPDMKSDTGREAAPIQRRRRAVGGDGARQLDDMGRRRTEFLRSRQSKNVQSPGRAPTPEDRKFQFEDDGEPGPRKQDRKD